MAKINPSGRQFNRILEDAEAAIKQVNDKLSKGESLPASLREKFEQISGYLSEQPKDIKAGLDTLDINLKKRVLEAIEILINSKKIPDLQSHINSVKQEILLLKEKTKIKRAGKTGLEGGGSHGSS